MISSCLSKYKDVKNRKINTIRLEFLSTSKAQAFKGSASFHLSE